MAEVLKVLTNIRSLRVLARNESLELLESILEKLQLVISEKREELLKIQQEEEARQERIAKYKDLLKKEGITVDELAEILGAEIPRKKREARPAKYQYVDENGIDSLLLHFFFRLNGILTFADKFQEGVLLYVSRQLLECQRLIVYS